MNHEQVVAASTSARVTTLSAVIIRADGTREDLGVIATDSQGPVEPSANTRKEL